MSTVELRKRLIDKIQKIEDADLLNEVCRLLTLETDDIELYKLNDGQKKAITQPRRQIKNGTSLTDDQSNKEIDEWLGE